MNFLKNYKKKEENLIPILQKIQGEYGYLSSANLKSLSEYLEIPLSKIYGTATFYSQFRFNKLGKFVISVCHGTSCHVNGAMDIGQALSEELGISEGETSSDGLFSIERVACLGCCSLSPVIMINDKIYGRLTLKKVRKIIKKLKRGNLK